MTDLNKTIHQPTRLRIMAMLSAFPPKMCVTFNYIKDTLELTDGNLGVHLRNLEAVKYITTTKRFLHNKPQTSIKITEAGREAFVEYSTALRELLKSNPQIGEASINE
jgi:DNA-binding MarR family transcriptional regulator